MTKNIYVYYRISDVGYKKNKPTFINNKTCFQNFINVFSAHKNNIHIIADNICNDTYSMLVGHLDKNQISTVSVGHGAGTFNIALDMCLEKNDDDVIYFVENDYLHKIDSDKIILDGLSLKPSFVTLYDHPDKYMDPEHGGNPYCHGGSEATRLYIGELCHWKITNSTTMTFASKVSTLKNTAVILRKWTSGTHPYDFQMFLDLSKHNHYLLSSVPGYATHGETEWLCPLTDWASI